MQGLMTPAVAAHVANCRDGHLYRITAREQSSADAPVALYVKAANRDAVQRRLPKLRGQDGVAVIEHEDVKIRGPFTVTRVCPRRHSDGRPEEYDQNLHGRCYCRSRQHNCCLQK